MNSKLPIATVLPCYTDTVTGITKTVGNDVFEDVSKTGNGGSGSNLSEIATVADITSPSSWTEFLPVTGKSKIVWRNHATGNAPLKIAVYASEDAGEAIRAQVLIDGAVVWDSTATRAAGSNPVQILNDLPSWLELYCEESFLVKVAVQGVMVSASSYVYIGSAYVTSLA